MYIKPGAVFEGFGLCARRSMNHCMPIGSSAIGTSPMMFSLPGLQTHSLVPLDNTCRCPSASISATVASAVTIEGPERRARLIFSLTIASVIPVSPFELGESCDSPIRGPVAATLTFPVASAVEWSSDAKVPVAASEPTNTRRETGCGNVARSHWSGRL